MWVMTDFQELKSLIDTKRGSCVDFGTHKNAPSEEWVKKAEERLGNRLPPTYKWFLSNYVYSILALMTPFVKIF